MRKLKNDYTDLQVTYRDGEIPVITGWYYEDKHGIDLYSDLKNPKRESTYLGKISKRKLLGIVSRIYRVDFSKYIKK